MEVDIANATLMLNMSDVMIASRHEPGLGRARTSGDADLNWQSERETALPGGPYKKPYLQRPANEFNSAILLAATPVAGVGHIDRRGQANVRKLLRSAPPQHDPHFRQSASD